MGSTAALPAADVAAPVAAAAAAAEAAAAPASTAGAEQPAAATAQAIFLSNAVCSGPSCCAIAPGLALAVLATVARVCDYFGGGCSPRLFAER